MGTCIYCGKRVGFFSKYHEACSAEAAKNRQLGVKAINVLIKSCMGRKHPIPNLSALLAEAGSDFKLGSEDIGHAVLASMDEISKQEPLETASAQYLFALCEKFFGDLDEIRQGSPFHPSCRLTAHTIALSNHLWKIMHGEEIKCLNTCDVVLQPRENRLAEFGTVFYRKSVIVSTHNGSYNGVGVRVASGLYYRFGRYEGHTLSSADVQNIDTGFWIMTNFGMYFAGQQTTFRIPYSSILRFKAYPDGLGFFRSIGAGREEIFSVLDPLLSTESSAPVPINDGWFLYNLATFVTTSK